jgi:hypothetical protein
MIKIIVFRSFQIQENESFLHLPIIGQDFVLNNRYLSKFNNKNLQLVHCLINGLIPP